MAERLKVLVRASGVQVSHGDDYVSLSFEDKLSGIGFLSIEMSYAEFGKLIGARTSIELEASVRGLDRIGKKHVWESRSVVVPDEAGLKPYSSRKADYQKWLLANCQEEGWVIDAYLGSRDSVVHSGDKTTLRYTVRKWVPISEAQCPDQ